jgi:hypothetical protein
LYDVDFDGDDNLDWRISNVNIHQVVLNNAIYFIICMLYFYWQFFLQKKTYHFWIS